MRGKVNKFLFTKIPKIKTLLSKIYFVKHLFNSINYTTISINPVQNVITEKLLTTQQSPSPPITHYFALQNSQTTSQKSQLFLNS